MFLFHMRNCPFPSISILIHNLCTSIHNMSMLIYIFFFFDICTLLLSIKKAMNAWPVRACGHSEWRHLLIPPKKQAIQLLHTSSPANRMVCMRCFQYRHFFFNWHVPRWWDRYAPYDMLCEAGGPFSPINAVPSVAFGGETPSNCGSRPTISQTFN